MKRSEYERKLATLNRARDVELHKVYKEAEDLLRNNNDIRSKLSQEEKKMECKIEIIKHAIYALHEEVMACLQQPFEDE